MTQYVALLRGINVGGNNLIKMTELRACFESLGFADVTTYIQSGNVLFDGPRQRSARLAALIEAALSDRFGYQSRIVLRTHAQLRAIVADAPANFGSQPDIHRYDVVFLREPVTAAEAIKEVPTRDGVDQVYAGKGVCYFSRLVSRASQSYMSRIIGLPSYQSMTIRNWNTTVKLLALMDARAASQVISHR
ncbi:MAG TPA: DUF1697 domain-containing protein [Chloroflexota bacterium]|jgi:uncharacterized protein (DUF1697 family)|nr:DUF1697 domain-containing protein [Chloroflexota bacterium]